MEQTRSNQVRVLRKGASGPVGIHVPKPALSPLSRQSAAWAPRSSLIRRAEGPSNINSGTRRGSETTIVPEPTRNRPDWHALVGSAALLTGRDSTQGLRPSVAEDGTRVITLRLGATSFQLRRGRKWDWKPACSSLSGKDSVSPR